MDFETIKKKIMKNFEFEEFEVVQISTQEALETEGGWIWFAAAAAAIATYDAVSDFIDGFSAGFAARSSQTLK